MLIAPTEVKISSMDINENVKIPYQSSLLASGTPDSEGWVQTASMKATSNGSLLWSSLFGIPIGLGTKLGNTTFNIESTYIELSCNDKTLESLEPSGPNGPRINFTYISVAGPYFSAADPDPLNPWIIGYRGVDIKTYNDTDGTAYVSSLFCPDCLRSDFANKTVEAGTIAFQEFDCLDNAKATTVFCNPYQRYVESEVACMKTAATQQCQVTAQRDCVLPHMPSEITYLSFPLVALGLSALLPNVTPIHNATNEVQNYLVYDPLDPLAIIGQDNSVLKSGGPSPKFLSDVALSDIGTRLGQILNAFVYGSTWNASVYLLGESIDNLQGHEFGGKNASFIPATRADIVAMIQNQTAAFTVPTVLRTQAQVYVCNFAWLGVFLLSTVVMLVGAITGVVFSRKTIVPDYLGYVSSLAKESPWIRMPDIGVNMDGMDKARLVNEIKVRIGDVIYVHGGHSEIGRLAFARLEETTKVKKGKLYV